MECNIPLTVSYLQEAIHQLERVAKEERSIMINLLMEDVKDLLNRALNETLAM